MSIHISDYRQLFIQLEDVLGDVMKRELDKDHTDGERDWTPPK